MDAMPDHHALTPAQWQAVGREIAAQRARDGLPPYRGKRDLRVEDVLLAELLVLDIQRGRQSVTEESDG